MLLHRDARKVAKRKAHLCDGQHPSLPRETRDCTRRPEPADGMKISWRQMSAMATPSAACSRYAPPGFSQQALNCYARNNMTQVMRHGNHTWAGFQARASGCLSPWAFCSAQCLCCLRLALSAGRCFASWRRPETAPQRRNALVSQLRHGDAASGQLADARPLGYGAAPVAQPGPVAPPLSPLLVRAGRLELPRPLGQQILSLPRLPFRHARSISSSSPALYGLIPGSAGPR